MFWCAVLALAILSVPLLQSLGQGAGAKKDIEKMAADLAAGKKVSDDDVKKFVKKHDDLEDVMDIFKAPKKGNPSMELVLMKLSKKETHTPADKATLKKIAELSRAVARLTPHYDEKTKGDAAKKKVWDKYTKDMDDGAAELLESIKSGNGKSIQTTATKLLGSCTDCHSEFR